MPKKIREDICKITQGQEVTGGNQGKRLAMKDTLFKIKDTVDGINIRLDTSELTTN